MNTGRIWVELKPRGERQLSVDQAIAELRRHGVPTEPWARTFIERGLLALERLAHQPHHVGQLPQR